MSIFASAVIPFFSINPAGAFSKRKMLNSISVELYNLLYQNVYEFSVFQMIGLLKG
jgi:hypothetical protein